MTKATVAKRITDRVMRNSGLINYLDIINSVSDREVFAIAVTTLDETVTNKDFAAWVNDGYSHSKRAMRVFHRVMDSLTSPESQAVLQAKKNFIYSVSTKQNIASTNLYRANRAKFLKEANTILESM